MKFGVDTTGGAVSTSSATVPIVNTGYICASCGAWVGYGMPHTCRVWSQPFITPNLGPPYDQQPSCPDETPPELYRCRKGHWHPMPEAADKGRES